MHMGDTIKWGKNKVIHQFDVKRGFVHLTEVPAGFDDVKIVAGKDYLVVACSPDKQPIAFSRKRERWEYIHNGEPYAEIQK
jgi:hypothetical protein